VIYFSFFSHNLVEMPKKPPHLGLFSSQSPKARNCGRKAQCFRRLGIYQSQISQQSFRHLQNDWGPGISYWSNPQLSSLTQPPPPPPPSPLLPPPPPPLPTPTFLLRIPSPSYILISIQTLSQFLESEMMCRKCRQRNVMQFSTMKKNNLYFSFALQCRKCLHLCILHSSPQPNPSDFSEVNFLMAVACHSIPIGHTHVNQLLSSFGHPIIHSKVWEKWRETIKKIVYNLWDIQQKKNMLTEIAIMKEKEKVLVFDEKQRVLLTCSYDMTWTTRGHHSNIGIGLYVGSYSRLPLFVGFRSKKCRKCEAHKKKNIHQDPPPHSCTLTWHKSSGKFILIILFLIFNFIF
jgi:hypothetical protein